MSLGKGGGSSDTHDVSQTTRVEMPDWLDAAFQNVAGGAQDLYDTGGRSYFPNAGFVPLSQNSLEGLNTLSGLSMDPSQIPGYADTFRTFQDTLGGDYLHRGSGASPFLYDTMYGNQYGAGADLMRDTIAGDYLYGGEGFNAAMGAAERSILPNVKSRFNTAGRTSSALAPAAMTEELGDVFAGMYQTERGRQDAAGRLQQALGQGAAGQINEGYQRERAMQNAAMGMAPSMYQLAMAPGQTQMGVGGALQDEQQRELSDQMTRWAFEQDEPYRALQALSGTLTPMGALYAGRDVSGQQPVYDSGGSGLLGAALSLGSMFIPGASGGGLSGLFGGGLGSTMGLGDTLGSFDIFA